ncbi:hypothetical protein DPX16_12546 [Anabarilius grahami]|uniref:Uncharacterized protein n=1 Tax=Anabarilius grahami TaxID=495550 RepID=A0A3N0XRA3_ANAGA|nr:hypothetical protein DPX16_12546 [Anabarilius grahami]
MKAVIESRASAVSLKVWVHETTQILELKQGSRSLEDYIEEYLDIAYCSDLPDCVLIDFFCDGVNQPLKSQLIREGPRSSLSRFLDYALLTVGSPFTVGVTEERDTSSGRTSSSTLPVRPRSFIIKLANGSLPESRFITIVSLFS